MYGCQKAQTKSGQRLEVKRCGRLLAGCQNMEDLLNPEFWRWFVADEAQKWREDPIGQVKTYLQDTKEVVEEYVPESVRNGVRDRIWRQIISDFVG